MNLRLNNKLRIYFIQISCFSGIANRFSQYHKPDYYEYLVRKNAKIAQLRRASLLIPISIRNDADISTAYFTFTQRAQNMRFYGGQICFIGGNRDKSDCNDQETALREAYEETAIPRNRLTVLAQLIPFLATNTGREPILITPLVALYDNNQFNPILNPVEVEKLHQINTDIFLESQNHEANHMEIYNDEYFMHYFNGLIPGDDRSIFGVTAFAAIVASVALHGRLPAFDLDPILKLLTPDTLNAFLEAYLLRKSLLNKLAK